MSEHTSEVRLNILEQKTSAQSTDIRGIYGALDEIRDVLVRMQESAKPNIMAMFLVLIAVCTFMVTIGGLTLAPLIKNQERVEQRLDEMHSQQIASNKLAFKIPDAEALEDKLREEHNNSDQRLEARMHYNEDRITKNAIDNAYAKGQMDERARLENIGANR